MSAQGLSRWRAGVVGVVLPVRYALSGADKDGIWKVLPAKMTRIYTPTITQLDHRDYNISQYLSKSPTRYHKKSTALIARVQTKEKAAAAEKNAAAVMSW